MISLGSQSQLQRLLHYFFLFSFLLIATLWLLLVWDSAPLILNFSDAGNIASAIASFMHPQRFSNDLLFNNPKQFNFYISLSIPIVMGLTKILGDIGQAYTLPIWALLLFQMLGFYLLGQKLFVDKFWAWILALLTIPSVGVFSRGELWGQIDIPLTRSYYSALFPFILLLCLASHRKYLPIYVMLLCGLGIYIHPVSAPSIALACWLSLFCCKPTQLTWFQHTVRIIGVGFIFVVLAIPFVIIFFSAFPSAAPIKEVNSATIAITTLSAKISPLYFNVTIAIKTFFQTLFLHSSWHWLFWLTGLIGLILSPTILQHKNYPRYFLVFFTLSVILSSFGVTWLDQTVTSILERHPIQLDLVRNIRYLIPLLQIGVVLIFVGLTSTLFVNSTSQLFIKVISICLVLAWWISFPTPLTEAGKRWFQHSPNSQPLIQQTSSKEMLLTLAQLPANSIILTLPQPDPAKLFDLAIRYSALQPLAHLWKDIDFLSYSGSSQTITRWLTTANDIELLNASDNTNKTAILKNIITQEKVNYIVVNLQAISPLLLETVKNQTVEIKTIGPWYLAKTKINS